MSTSEALRRLANREICQVCLLQAGRFSALVTYDSAKEELVFHLFDPKTPISVRALLFQTEPAWVL